MKCFVSLGIDQQALKEVKKKKKNLKHKFIIKMQVIKYEMNGFMFMKKRN